MLNTLHKFAERRLCIAAVLMLLLLSGARNAHAARYALLIGNDNYEAVAQLKNARADAETMAVALRKAGYVTTVVKDRSLKQLKDDIRTFKSRVNGGDEVVLFYSGHGVQIGAMNYLLPIDVRSESEDQVKDDALPLSKVLEDIREQKPALTLAIIDACRDNPFKGAGRAIGGRGLTGVSGATGQMVIYSAGEGQQALDRLGANDTIRNGVFTRVFIKEMEKPGVPVDQVTRNVRLEVNRLAHSVGHEQVPAIYDQVLGQFYFYAPNGKQDDATGELRADMLTKLQGTWMGSLRCGPYLGKGQVPTPGSWTASPTISISGKTMTMLRGDRTYTERLDGTIGPDGSWHLKGQGHYLAGANTPWTNEGIGKFDFSGDTPRLDGQGTIVDFTGTKVRECTYFAMPK